MPAQRDPYTGFRVGRRPDQDQLFFPEAGASWRELQASYEREIVDLKERIARYEVIEAKRAAKVARAAARVARAFKIYNHDNPWILDHLISLLECLRRNGFTYYRMWDLWSDLCTSATAAVVVKQGKGAVFPHEYVTIYARWIKEVRPDLGAMLRYNATWRFGDRRLWDEPVELSLAPGEEDDPWGD